MSFTTDVKKEIIARGISQEGLTAAISAYLRTSGDIWLVEGELTFYFVSESERVAEFFTAAFAETFGVELVISHATRDRMSGRHKLVMECPKTEAATIAKRLGLLHRSGEIRAGIPTSLVQTEKRLIAYIQGAFLGGGSCLLPAEEGKTGYHLEFVFPTKKTAQDFCRLLAEVELLAKVAQRKETFLVYIKSKELISDFLSVIGAETCLKKLSTLVEKRDKSNNDNRARNCVAGNADKTAIAAVKQVVAIEKLLVWTGFEELSEELKNLAFTRKDNPMMSLAELAAALGVSKSCLNHRMRKLMEIARTLEKE